MSILFLKGGEQEGIVDLENRVAVINKKKIGLPPGSVLKAGDTVEISGARLTVYDYMPSFNDIYSERTFQSIKAHDASYMITMSGIKPGSSVIESGVGNGTFTSHLLWQISSNGKLTGVDLSDRALESCRELLSNFFDLKNWTPVRGDIKTFTDSSYYDACFLDIPEPWEAIGNLQKIIRPGGSLIVYSPNYNQIEKSALEMERNGFEIMETVELLKRNILVREGKTRPDQKMIGHTAFITVGFRKSGFSLRLR